MRMVEKVNSCMTHLIYCNNMCKCHKVPISIKIKEKKNKHVTNHHKWEWNINNAPISSIILKYGSIMSVMFVEKWIKGKCLNTGKTEVGRICVRTHRQTKSITYKTKTIKSVILNILKKLKETMTNTKWTKKMICKQLQ
jgi:hypothetical protein